jgi:DNA-directed RNA polymerase subunit M/transcription elongation factor TFIIS
MARFNIIGFGPGWQRSSRWYPTKTCAVHSGTILIPKRDESGEYEPGVLICPECGSRYTQDNEKKSGSEIEEKRHIVRK